MAVHPSAPDLLALRTRWTRLAGDGSAPSGTSVHLLASYTIDPLVPYTGVHLHDAGVPVRLSVGPYHQILQQCLDDSSETGRLRPDVLVVAPRPEDFAGGDARDLVEIADAALAAAQRWRSCLVFVLPAVPEQRPFGIGDEGRRTGTAASAAALREHLRVLLADRPNVLLADAERAVRAVGAGVAHRPVMYRLARVPYAEAVFDHLGRQLVGLLRLRLGRTRRAVVLDVTGLDADGLAELREPLELLRRRGHRLAIRAADRSPHTGAVLAGTLPELLADSRVELVADGRPLAEQLASVAARLQVPSESTILLTAAAAPLDAGPAEIVRLIGEPADWTAHVVAAGVLDALPVPEEPGAAPHGVPPEGDAPTYAAGGQVSLADFIEGLGVQVTFDEVDRALDDRTSELVARAHDFTLGENRTPHASGPGFSVAARVTDRLGDYGTSAVAAVHYADAVAEVDVFSVSCPAMGRGVEERVLWEIVARADADGCHTVLVEYEETGRNQVAADFLSAAAERTWKAPSGREVRMKTVRKESDR
ncbi:hypothetical protein [Streptomyces arenae]|uniref:hypothetical protein n=1 Tax=Streptomyces arenae TaxID=29301 RepID=UPI0026582BCE|nr:hypothetical protein [Streptomyces arenae]MCG7204949.1 hypothetical protein [Streptomyces arenae]